jgi:hypothetical protein
MSKAGNRHIRKALFFPAMSAMRFNPICKAFLLEAFGEGFAGVTRARAWLRA